MAIMVTLHSTGPRSSCQLLNCDLGNDSSPREESEHGLWHDIAPVVVTAENEDQIVAPSSGLVTALLPLHALIEDFLSSQSNRQRDTSYIRRSPYVGSRGGGGALNQDEDDDQPKPETIPTLVLLCSEWRKQTRTGNWTGLDLDESHLIPRGISSCLISLGITQTRQPTTCLISSHSKKPCHAQCFALEFGRPKLLLDKDTVQNWAK
ncbi:hypothetical protein Fcan01_03944 [Folsomia candida]|uniref:Uncharacterized protein n=1 Tax=Folsomia candida TaxID=158441 RepID=A0A226EYN2_FOLCA|nr:hypothetical protein Fcan01_03944 [Folsomia candida]